MREKLRQISDTIHQTVYLSELESNMMSTAYFYRLHDVYQSSTVYLTFPSNRTKRYEHSYGTMELAGEMFFSAITNAREPVLKDFFEDSEKYLRTVVTKLLDGRIHPTYCSKSYSALSECFPAVLKKDIEQRSNDIVAKAYENFESIEDIALNHYMPPFSVDLDKRKFLYQCLLEAVRIVALFHDIGHPPYSHIMEQVLNDLYAECLSSDVSDNKRKKELIDNLQPFKEAKSDNISCLISTSKERDSDLHEQVGLKMLTGAFEDIFQTKFERLKREKISKDKKSTVAVYYVAVAEFCFAILREEASFFTSLHRIVDGCVDVDRMDYIVRDSQNSGVDWGTIPYKRILESCKMIRKKVNNNKFYFMSFPRKMSDHIDDLLITRYKIFSRINYHHRSYKTALILQKLVKTLADDYLRKNDTERELCPGIADLWNCLSSTMNSGDLYIIQWNDSTLISHLYHTLADVKSSSHEQYDLPEEEFDNISDMLEEFLLNRKHFHSVFKRQSDLVPIFSDVFQHLESLITRVKDHEKDKLENAQTQKDSEDADDSLKRLDSVQIDGIIKSGDADSLTRVFPVDLKSIIVNVLEDYKSKGEIKAFLFDENSKRSKTGLPNRDDKSDRIYLYESGAEDAQIYDVSNLENQLVQLQNNCLQYIAYVEPKTESDSVVTIGNIRKAISDRLYEEIVQCMKELFSCLRT